MAAVLEFAELPAEGRLLCLGLDPEDLATGRRGLGPAVCLVPAAPAPGGRASAWPALVVGDSAALPFRPGSVSAALCVDLLHRQGDPEAVLTQVVEVVEPGGRLVIHEPLSGLGSEELSAHLAGEGLAVLAHRHETAAAGEATHGTWLLQVAPAPASPGRTYLQEDR
jgi:SAM-dependent methyltransferase